MKKNVKNTVLFILLSVFLFAGCQNDDLNENPASQSQELPTVSADELLLLIQDPDVRNSVIKYTNQRKNLNRTIGNLDSNFEKLDLKEFDNYTLPLNNYTEETPYYDSFVVTIDNNNVSNAFYVQYTPKEQGYNKRGYNSDQGLDINHFSGTMGITNPNTGSLITIQLENGQFVNTIGETSDCETTIIITEVPCTNGGLHGVGEPCKEDFANDAYFVISIHVSCGPQYIFAGGYAGGGSGGGGGGGGGGGAAVPSTELFYNSLAQGQKDFLDENPKIKSNVNAFLNKFRYADNTAATYAKGIINEMMVTGLVFDVYRSFKSPVNVNITSVQGNTPEEVKFRKVYDKLTDSDKFKELFVNLFGTSGSINTIFKIDNLPVDGTCQLINSPKGIITNEITLKRDMLLTSSDIRIARVIIHECIHAFLSVKLKHPDMGMSIPEINNMDFTEVINTLYNGLLGNNAQHDFFIDHMIPVMAETLSQCKQLLLTQEQISKVDNPEDSTHTIFLPSNTTPPTNSGIPTPWVWSDFFKYLSLEGLHEADSFYTVYPVNSVEYYYFKQYVTKAIVVFTP